MDFSEAKDYIIERLVNELPRDLYYHGPHHTFDVVKSIYALGEAEKLTNENFYLLLTAAYFHDAGYLYKYDSNEKIAVKMIHEVLPPFGYTEKQIEIIEGIILSTSNDVEPKTHLEQIMCDADHDYLGRKDYHQIAVQLRKELSVYDREFDDKEWIEMQINYLEKKHRFYTTTAILTREPIKKARVDFLKRTLNSLSL
jgi:adenylate cyclase